MPATLLVRSQQSFGVLAEVRDQAAAVARPGRENDVTRLDTLQRDARTEKLLDWHPTHPGLIADLEKEHYFRNR
ncbi:hypothetical protein ACWCOV_03825 [Kribbella sp. NPDC002412]